MEILAPAGSMDVLHAAVQSGADAVYIGGTEFSARRSAANFTISQIAEAVRYCHLRGAKLHVAANILVKEKEKQAFLDYVGKLNDLGIDAVIIQDIGMASAVRKCYPDLPLHASTQMTVTNLSGALFLQNIGFSRIVLARELSKEVIKKICDGIKIETEVFAHGALCMSYSGQCLMSSIIGGRSGNRGMCAQPCRLPYELDKKSGYFLSPKDLSMIDHLTELSEIGVTSLKIEGRLKRKEYVAAVTGIYKKYEKSGKKPTADDKNALLSAFNRSGFTDGYFADKQGISMMSIENPSNISENVFSDDVKICCAQNANLRKREVFISASIYTGKPVTVSMWDNDGHFAEFFGENPLEARKNGAFDINKLKEQLLKLGNTPFFANSAEIMTDNAAMVSFSELNNARRRVCELFEADILKSEKRRSIPFKPSGYRKYSENPKLVADVCLIEQVDACIEAGIDEIYVPADIYEAVKAKYRDIPITAKLPPVTRDDRNYVKTNAGRILVSNIGQIDKSRECIGNYRLNVANSESVAFFDGFLRTTLSAELNISELMQIAAGNEVVAYGRLSLMTMENCPLKSLGKCQNGKFLHYFRDRMGEKFPLKCAEGCVCELLNSKPIYMADKLKDLLKLNPAALRLIFTVENPTECGKIVKDYKMGLEEKDVLAPAANTFTRGHFYRGVE